MQLSFFTDTEPTAVEIKAAENTEKRTSVNPALVPDSEFGKTAYKKIPTVKDIIKLLDKTTYKVGLYELLSDIVECSAIAISNQFDFRNYHSREEKYKAIMKKYDDTTKQLICEIFANIYVLLSSQVSVGFNDYLGELFMSSNTSSSKAGQFFTPYNISKLCAKASIDKAILNEHITNDTILTVHEPTCGAGGMIIALADVLYNDYHFNISRNMFVECGDIDTRCVHMCYLQLALAGIPAIIYHRDGLSLKTWDKWVTPAYLMQYTRFKKYNGGIKNDTTEHEK